MILKGEHLKWSAKRWTLLILPVALIAVMLWVLIPKGSAAAQGSKETLEKHRAEEREKMERELKSRDKELQEKALLPAVEEIAEVEKKRELRRELEMKLALQGAEVLAQVSELQVIIGKRHNDVGEKLFEVSAAETMQIGEETRRTNVVVKTPELTIRAEQATERNGIINIIGTPIEVESRGQVYYSYNPIAVAQRGGIIMYVISTRASLFKEKNQLSEHFEFAKVLRD